MILICSQWGKTPHTFLLNLEHTLFPEKMKTELQTVRSMFPLHRARCKHRQEARSTTGKKPPDNTHTKSHTAAEVGPSRTHTHTHTGAAVHIPAAEVILGIEEARLTRRWAEWTARHESHPLSPSPDLSPAVQMWRRRGDRLGWCSAVLVQFFFLSGFFSWSIYLFRLPSSICLKEKKKYGCHICVIYFHSYSLNIGSVIWIAKRHLSWTNTAWQHVRIRWG